MKPSYTKALLLVMTVLIGIGGAMAAEPNPPAANEQNRAPMHDGMMGGGMMGGMMNMMGQCHRMMGGSMMGSGTMPQLPPGNEKLQLQMQAEIMQRVGEILNKYAAKVKDDQGGTR